MPRRAEPGSSRPRHTRLLLLAAVIASGALLAAPTGAAPRGQVLDLVGGPATGPQPAAGVEPGSTSAPAAVPTSTPTPRLLGDGVPPERLMVENGDRTAPPPGSLVGYVWPIRHPRLTLPFGPTPWGTRVVDGQLFHDGIDIATFCGDRITAAHDGIVLAAGRHFDDLLGWVGDLGPYYARLNGKHLWFELPIVVVIDDGNGYRSIYAHFGRIVVQRGQDVRAGQLLGFEGATGHASGCHLHYSLFSPWERATFGIDKGVVKRMKVPKLEIARIDPLLVLPPKKGIP